MKNAMRHIAVLSILFALLSLAASLVIPIHRGLTLQNDDDNNYPVLPIDFDEDVVAVPCGMHRPDLGNDESPANEDLTEWLDFEVIETDVNSVTATATATTTFSAVATSTVAVTTSEVEVDRVVLEEHPVEGEDGAVVVVEEVVVEEVVETVLEIVYEPEAETAVAAVVTATAVQETEEVKEDVVAEEEETDEVVDTVVVEITYDPVEEQDSTVASDADDDTAYTDKVTVEFTYSDEDLTAVDVTYEFEVAETAQPQDRRPVDVAVAIEAVY